MMKPRIWAAALIFLSGYSPLLLIMCFRDFNFQQGSFEHPRTVVALMAIAIASVFLVFVALRSIHSGLPIRIISLRSRATDLVNYSLPYIVSFFGLKLNDPHDMGSLAVLMLLLFILAFRTNSLFINPILACGGYQLFEAECEENGYKKTRDVLVKGEILPGDLCRAELLSTSLLLITTSSSSEHHEYPTVAGAIESEEAKTSDRPCDLMASL